MRLFETVFGTTVFLFLLTALAGVASILSDKRLYYHLTRIFFLCSAAAILFTGAIRFYHAPDDRFVSMTSTIWGYFYVLSCMGVASGVYLYFSRWNRQWKSFMAITALFIMILLLLSIPFIDSTRRFATELNSQILPVHIVASMVGELLFFFSFSGSVFYLIMEKGLKGKKLMHITDRLPNLESIEKFNRWAITYSLALMTLGLFLGIYLVSESFGKLFVGTAKEMHIYFTWALILGIFILRKWSRLSPHRISMANILFFAAAMFLVILTNTYIARGFHSFQ